jgi:hypothetical protein
MVAGGECRPSQSYSTYRSRAVFKRGRIGHGREEKRDHRINGCEEEERHNCECLLVYLR